MTPQRTYLFNVDKNIPFEFCKSIASEHNLGGMIVVGNQAINAKRVFDRKIIPIMDFPWGMSCKEQKLMGLKWFKEKGFEECMVTLPINGIVDEGVNFLLEEIHYLAQGCPKDLKISWYIGSIELALLDDVPPVLKRVLKNPQISSLWITTSARLDWKDNLKITRSISRASREIGFLLSEDEAGDAENYIDNGIDKVAIEANAITQALYPVKGGKL